eukprot:1653142-Alexandrium_andersonii.AAC.1
MLPSPGPAFFVPGSRPAAFGARAAKALLAPRARVGTAVAAFSAAPPLPGLPPWLAARPARSCSAPSTARASAIAVSPRRGPFANRAST